MHSILQLVSLTISSTLCQHVNIILSSHLVSASAPIRYLVTYRLSQDQLFVLFSFVLFCFFVLFLGFICLIVFCAVMSVGGWGGGGGLGGLIITIQFAAPYRRSLMRHTIEGGAGRGGGGGG